jgi:membrane protein
MAGATAFFSTFAITPILIIIIQLSGIFFTADKLTIHLMSGLRMMVGTGGAAQIQQTAKNITSLAQNWYITLFGFLFMLFVATTLFSVIESSLNQIWMIRLNPGGGLRVTLKRRLRSVVVIVVAGILFIAGLFTEGAQAILGNYIELLFPDTGKLLNSLINEVIFIAIVIIWFTCLFRFLTEGRPLLKIAFAGGILTGILFDLGKMIVSWGLSRSNIGTIYGASGSIVLTMLFVFYSSLIFYFGGCFIKVLSEKREKSIRPRREAYRYEIYKV